MSTSPSLDSMRELVVGTEESVTLLDGSRRAFINFDNASSTPFLHSVLDRVNEFAPLYASVGRGSGYKSHLSTEAFAQARATIGRFVGASLDTHAVILGKNTTEALNRVAHCLQLSQGDVVLTSLMEHHSNDLPWRRSAEVHHIGLCDDGSLDIGHVTELLERFQGRVRAVAISGASNVTGYINPIHDIAALVHDAGGVIVVDAAQLAPHRTIDMLDEEDPRHIDFLAYTGHKMYAPLGIGALVALRSAVRACEPEIVGGGTVDFVTEDDVVWSRLPEREEAGTPNIVGAIGWAQAIDELTDLGMDRVATHESELAAKMLSSLEDAPKVEVFGDPKPSGSRDRLGVVTFRVKGISHRLIAAILGYEGGIAVRTGLFCAHTYVQKLLGLSADASETIARGMRSGDRPQVPGLVRASFGIYNTVAEVEDLVAMLDVIAAERYAGEYVLDPETGAYAPADCDLWGEGEDAWSPRGCT